MISGSGTKLQHPLMTPAFFALGISLASHPDSHTISAEDGEFSISLEVPQAVD